MLKILFTESCLLARDLVKGKPRLLWGGGDEFVVPQVRKVTGADSSPSVPLSLMRLGGNFRNVRREVLGLVCWTSLLVFDAILRRPLL